LDEIGELSLTTRAKLLRVVQFREFERPGGTETLQMDVRIIAARRSNTASRARAAGDRSSDEASVWPCGGRETPP
jgi:transcriptional regulator with GAF, ATPase, and Fis domain